MKKLFLCVAMMSVASLHSMEGDDAIELKPMSLYKFVNNMDAVDIPFADLDQEDQAFVWNELKSPVAYLLKYKVKPASIKSDVVREGMRKGFVSALFTFHHEKDSKDYSCAHQFFDLGYTYRSNKKEQRYQSCLRMYLEHCKGTGENARIKQILNSDPEWAVGVDDYEANECKILFADYKEPDLKPLRTALQSYSRDYTPAIQFLKKHKNALLKDKDCRYERKWLNTNRLSYAYMEDIGLSCQNIDHFDAFLAAGLDPNLYEFSGPTSICLLDQAFCFGEEHVCLLLAYGVDCKSDAVQRKAVEEGFIGVLQYLVDYKMFNPHAQWHNYTMLEYACNYACTSWEWQEDKGCQIAQDEAQEKRVIAFLKQHGCTE